MIGATCLLNVGTSLADFAAYCSPGPLAFRIAAPRTMTDVPIVIFTRMRVPLSDCDYLTIGTGAIEGVKSKPVYCISSHVWSPHFTSVFGSGFDLFAAELSYHAVATIFAPFGTCSGSLNM